MSHGPKLPRAGPGGQGTFRANLSVVPKIQADLAADLAGPNSVYSGPSLPVPRKASGLVGVPSPRSSPKPGRGLESAFMSLSTSGLTIGFC